MFEAVASPYLVKDDGKFSVKKAKTAPPKDAADKKKCKKRLAKRIDEISELQRMLYAHDRYAILLIFQAMDAAGKDGTIRAVMSGINPAGCQVFSFKQPSAEELDHDFSVSSTAAITKKFWWLRFIRNISRPRSFLKIPISKTSGRSAISPFVTTKSIWHTTGR